MKDLTTSTEMKREDILGLYSKEYHESHINWARGDARIFRHYRDNYLELVKPTAGMRILEIGCSSGKTTAELLARKCHVIACDFDSRAIEIAKKYVLEKNGSLESVDFVHSSADEPQLMQHKFDKVTMLDFVEHVPDSILSRVFTNLKNAGFSGEICIYTPHRYHFTELLRALGIMKQDPTHINLKSKQEWEKTLSQMGLKIETCERRTSHWPVLKTLEKLSFQIPLVREIFTRSISLRART